MIPHPAVFALNHLLARESFARERLRPCAGQRVRLRLPPLPDLTLAITAEGLVERASTAASPELVVTLKPATLAQLLAGDERGLRDAMVEGDGELAAVVHFLAKHLRWDVEEDLSRLVGDPLAHRLAAAGRGLAGWHKDALRRAGENMAEYLQEETGTLARPAEMSAFGRDVADLRDAVERLEKRIGKLAAAPDSP